MMAVDSERSLVFGILAFQNGLIEQSDFFAAFDCWLKEPTRSMAQILIERGTLSEADRTALDELVLRHALKDGGGGERSAADLRPPVSPLDRLLEGAKAGDVRTDPLASIDFQEISSRILPDNLTISLDGKETVQGPDESSYRLGQTTSSGGRFRLLRHHARGGIGDVFVATDSELHREVVVKQIQPQHADDPASRARFLIEAEVTGRLEHPGIVPVYGLGTNHKGRPFYAMRFVRGQSLKEAIDAFHKSRRQGKRDQVERRLALHQLLQRFIDVCNAISYAHSRGVIHCDLKPANILLGPYGETLVVDWGLAKFVSGDDATSQGATELTLRPESFSSSHQTRVGRAIGTPAYMSPEQSEGRSSKLGPASDVYSLGSTLYCLITGRAPLEDQNIEAILSKLRRGEIKPPRAVNPRAAAVLEAIVLKAMALRPADRYPSARALADDVERWLADEPISARREPLVERARRWMRRNRPAVAALTGAFVMATVGLAAVLAVQTTANCRLILANSELEAAIARSAHSKRDMERANQRERARFELALEAIKTFHRGVSEDLLLKEKQFDGLRTKLLREATDFYRRMEDLLKEPADWESRAALAQAYHDIGVLTSRIGSQSEALAALRRGLELRRTLAEEPDSDLIKTMNTTSHTGQSLIAIAEVQETTGNFAGALAAYEQARFLFESTLKTGTNDDASRAAVANCLHGIASVSYHTGHASEALIAHEQARDIRQQLFDAHPLDSQYANDLAQSYLDIGAIHRAGGRAKQALAAYMRAREISEAVLSGHPEDTRLRSDLARGFINIAYVQRESGDFDGALKTLGQALVIWQKLAETCPADTRLKGDLARTCQAIGALQDQKGETTQALVSLECAREILEKLVDANPNVTAYQGFLATNHSFVGSALLRAGCPASAVIEFRKAIAIMERLSELQPDGDSLYSLACFRSLLAGAGTQSGSGLTPGEVSRLGKEAVATLRRAVAAGLQNVAFMRRDSDLDALRQREDFQLLLLDLDFPDEPFGSSDP
jgi:serine/threonine-protein kinase